MPYTVQIRDAELQSKLGNVVVEKVDKSSLSDLQRQITEKTGVQVFCKLNEVNSVVEVKRLLFCR